ncbi:MAG: hypothetical protein QOE14_2743 [Humisphaera sp.]|nr:hypothetical protein [Humisphaera sp.]
MGRIQQIILVDEHGAQRVFDVKEVVPPPPPPPPPPPSKLQSLVGGNIDSLTDYSSCRHTINLRRQARLWGRPEKPEDNSPDPLTGAAKIAVDAFGYATQDYGTWAFTEQASNAPHGTYALRWRNAQSVATNPPNSVANVRHAGEWSYADVIVPANQGMLALIFRGVSADHRWDLCRPGYSWSEMEQDVWSREFVDHLRGFGHIRFMDLFSTNNSTIAEWNNWPSMSSARWGNGIPLETAVLLCNRLECDMWANVPHAFRTGDVREMLRFIDTKLKPNLRCCLERSNEVWNSQFQQRRYFLEMARTLCTDPDLQSDLLVLALKDEAPTNETFWLWRLWAWHVAMDATIAAEISGRRFRSVFASQLSYAPPGYIVRHQLSWLRKHYALLEANIWGIASAPYFSPGSDIVKGKDVMANYHPDFYPKDTDPNSPKRPENAERDYRLPFVGRLEYDVDAIFARLSSRDNVNGESILGWDDVARDYGKTHVIYETGWDGGVSAHKQDVRIAANQDPRMGAVVWNHCTSWFADRARPRALYTIFVTCSRWHKTQWGFTDSPLRTWPKFDAIKQAAAQYTMQEP